MEADSSAKNLICNFLSKKEGGSPEFGDIHFTRKKKKFEWKLHRVQLRDGFMNGYMIFNCAMPQT